MPQDKVKELEVKIAEMSKKINKLKEENDKLKGITNGKKEQKSEKTPKIIYDFDGASIIITGGASGLGKATAEKLLASNANVIIVDYSDQGKQVADDLNKQFAKGKAKCLFIKTDVRDEEQIKRAVNFTIDNFGSVEGLVCSAGIGGVYRNIAEETLDNWNKVNSIDYTGLMLCNKYVVMQMIKQGKGGSIVNLSSMLGLVGMPSNVAYSAAKGGIVNLTRSAGTAFADKGIRVNCLCPGVIDTPLVPEDQKEIFAGLHPMKRIGKPEEVASLIAFLLSGAAKFITGASIPIDGGYTAV